MKPPPRLTWHWKIAMFNRNYIFKWRIFHCHVSLFCGVPTVNGQNGPSLLGTLSIMEAKTAFTRIPNQLGMMAIDSTSKRLASLKFHVLFDRFWSVPSLKLTAKYTTWFKVTFSSPSWRSRFAFERVAFSPSQKGHFESHGTFRMVYSHLASGPWKKKFELYFPY